MASVSLQEFRYIKPVNFVWGSRYFSVSALYKARLKKILFPVNQVAVNMASQAAAFYSFFDILSIFGKKL